MGHIIALANGRTATIHTLNDILYEIESALGDEFVGELCEYIYAVEEESREALAENESLTAELAQARLNIKQWEDQTMGYNDTVTATFTPCSSSAYPIATSLYATVDLTLHADPSLLQVFTALAAAIERGMRLETAELAETTPPAPLPAVANLPPMAAQVTTTAPDPAPDPVLVDAPELDAIMRAVKNKADAGFRPQLTEMINRYGGKSVSQIPAPSWGAFLAEVNALGVA